MDPTEDGCGDQCALIRAKYTVRTDSAGRAQDSAWTQRTRFFNTICTKIINGMSKKKKKKRIEESILHWLCWVSTDRKKGCNVKNTIIEMRFCKTLQPVFL